VVQVPEDVNEDLIRNLGDVDGFRFFFTFECEGFGEALDDLGYNTLWDGARVVCILRDV